MTIKEAMVYTWKAR